MEWNGQCCCYCHCYCYCCCWPKLCVYTIQWLCRCRFESKQDIQLISTNAIMSVNFCEAKNACSYASPITQSHIMLGLWYLCAHWDYNGHKRRKNMYKVCVSERGHFHTLLLHTHKLRKLISFLCSFSTHSRTFFARALFPVWYLAWISGSILQYRGSNTMRKQHNEHMLGKYSCKFNVACNARPS